MRNVIINETHNGAGEEMIKLKFTDEELEKISSIVDESIDNLGKWEGSEEDSDEYKLLLKIQDKIEKGMGNDTISNL